MTKVPPSSVPHEQSFPVLVRAWNDHPPAASETGGASDGSSSNVGVVRPRWMSCERSELSPCAIPSRPLPFSPVREPSARCEQLGHLRVDAHSPQTKALCLLNRSYRLLQPLRRPLAVEGKWNSFTALRFQSISHSGP